MKKSLVVGLLGFAFATAAYGQGRIWLDTYSTAPYPQITYGPSSWLGLEGAPVSQPLTVGFYWVWGDFRNYIPPYQPGGLGAPAPPPEFMQLATGTGSSVVLGGVAPGWFSAIPDYTFPGVSSGQVTMIVALYDGPSFDFSTYRWLSAPFLMTPTQGPGPAPGVGSAMPAFEIAAFPEPSVFALTGLGVAGLWLFRRRR